MATTKLFGQISRIGEIEIFGDKGFKKRELIIETVEQFPNVFKIEFTQAKCELLEPFSIGQNVAVSYNLQGRKYTKEDGEEVVFNSIVGWKIESISTDTPNSSVDQYER